jgi:hypothetical protein
MRTMMTIQGGMSGGGDDKERFQQAMQDPEI